MADAGTVTHPGLDGPRARPGEEQAGNAPQRGAGPIVRRSAGLALLVLGVAACASLRGTPAAERLPPADILAGTALGVTGSAPPQAAGDGEVLALSPEMSAFVAAHVDRGATDTLKFHQLISAIMDDKTFGVRYDETTRTAADTFRERRGNCLSFSNMFVAMARDVGLKVRYQEVDVPPDWTVDKETFVLNRHVDVVVDLERAGRKVVDFNIGDFKASYEMREISDARARAHFYNNIGVDRMQAGDTASALWCFRRAIVEDDGRFALAWTNLGTLYLRNGHSAHAEAAFLQAVRIDDSSVVALSNLARLYEQLEDGERAAVCRKKVSHDRWRNPYYRYQLARQAFNDRAYDAAISHLKFAVNKRPTEDQFCYLLARSYRAKGDERAARRWLARGDELAARNAATGTEAATKPRPKDDTPP